jgi:hypothetical protein
VLCLEVFDERLDGDDDDALTLAKLDEAGQAHHLAVFRDDLRNRPDGCQTGELEEVHRRFGVAIALANATIPGTERHNMAGAVHARWCGVEARKHAKGVGAVGGADTGADPVRGVHRHRVIGAARVLVVDDHHR